MSTSKPVLRFLKELSVIELGVPKATLSEREREICQRVCDAREYRGITQSECAEKTGIRRSTLANYESLATPLGYDEAKRLCYRLDINQRWLATGKLPRTPYFDLSPNLEFAIKPNSLFSRAFDDVLSVPIEERCAILIDLVGLKHFLAGKYDNAVLDTLHPIGKDPAEASVFYVSKVLQLRLHSMPNRFKSAFGSALLAADEKFKKEHGPEIKKLIRERQARDASPNDQISVEKTDLTNTATSEIITPVKELWPALKKRLQSATAATGKKSELAGFLGVDLTMVSRWLAEKKSAREPGAEYTLQLLHWVELQERQK